METKEINIAKILKDCPAGTVLYSTTHGEVELSSVCGRDIFVHYQPKNERGMQLHFFGDGKYSQEGECVLFPSIDQRDWSKFEKPVMPPFEIKPPKHGEVFFFVNALGEVQKIEDKEHIGVENDSIRMGFELGNYFNTREQAEYAAKKVKELLLSLRKEI